MLRNWNSHQSDILVMFHIVDTQQQTCTVDKQFNHWIFHYIDVIMSAIASEITSLAIVYSTVYSVSDQRKKTKLCVTILCEGNSPVTVNSPHEGPVARKMFPFDDVIMHNSVFLVYQYKYCQC